MPDPTELLDARGDSRELGAPVAAACFDRTGHHAGFALGDGTLRLVHDRSWHSVPAHDGAILSLAPHPAQPGFLTGGDDGRLNAIGLDLLVSPVASFGGKWVEHIAGFAGKTPLIAAAAGRNLHLLDGAGAVLRSLAHPSTVTGLAFDAKGKRVAASHYNGASLWFTGSSAETPNRFEWKGSHIGVALHPAGAALVTGMQENALHGWTLPDKKHMRMSGYPAKSTSFGFTPSGRWLATAGADTIVLWPFFGGGPMGKPPLELGGGDGALIRRIACHPVQELVAAGFDHGGLIVVDIAGQRVLPVCGPGRGEITALAWNESGSRLSFGTATGFAAVVDFSSQSAIG
jgi:WD40 repeat protein